MYLSQNYNPLDRIRQATDVDQAVKQLERIIRGHLDRCMPVRTVSMSSRDPG